MSGDKDQSTTSLRMRFDDPDDGSITDVAARKQQNTVNVSRYKHARILFPALGFPAVISPQSGASGDTRDPSRCVTLLILSRRPLGKADVARHLRWVPWEKRHTRWLPDALHGGTNAFREEEIDVRGGILSEREGRKFPRYLSQDRHTQLYHVGGDHEGEKTGFGVGLSRDVRRFYWRRNLRHINEVRIYESASARLPAGLLNLFWINRSKQDDENDRSQEMDLLLEEFAVSSRFGHDGIPAIDKFVGKTRDAQKSKYVREYEYEFGQPTSGAARVEVLHPVFVTQPQPSLRIGHLTDLHVAIRHDTYGKNLAKAGARGSKYHNWNRACEKLYSNAKLSCDALLMTGDLIDYGRGHDGVSPLGKDESYLRDRNWFLFYSFLAGGENYTKPAYTILGNHDWRLNPYPARAPGAPAPEAMKLSKDELEKAHGPGADQKWYEKDDTNWTSGAKKKLIDRDGSLEVKGTPLETVYESVAWYLLLINPFLDYTSPLPGGYQLAMLDWAEDEVVDRTVVSNGTDFGRTPLIPNTAGGPVAKTCLTAHQAKLVALVAREAGKAKILGIHAPPLGPWPHWPDDELRKGWVSWDPKKPSRGATGGKWISRDSYGRERESYEHRTYAITTSYEPAGQEADYGTFAKRRSWLIRKLRDSKFALVLAGHIHRQNILALKDSGIQNGPVYVEAVTEYEAAMAQTPLFVNTTSAGPLGAVHRTRNASERVDSGYTEIVITNTGKVLGVEFMDTTSKAKAKPRPLLSDAELRQVVRSF